MKSLKSAAGELVLIVAGVMIALSADAWMEGQRAQRDEGANLRAILGDLDAAVAALDESNASQDRIRAGLRSLLLTGGDANPDSLATWVEHGLYRLGTYEPGLGAVGAIEQTDAISRLPFSIQQGISRLNRLVHWVETTDEDLTRSQQIIIDPFLTQRYALAPALLRSGAVALDIEPGPIDREGLRSTEFRSIAVFKLALLDTDATRRAELAAHLSDLRRQILNRLEEI